MGHKMVAPALMRLLALSIVFVITTANFALAGGTVYLGTGGESCGTWISHRRTPLGLENLVDQSWVVGYLTGYNQWGAGNGDVSENTDSRGMMVWIDQYCIAHPLDLLGDAATKLVLVLELHRSSKRSRN